FGRHRSGPIHQYGADIGRPAASATPSVEAIATDRNRSQSDRAPTDIGLGTIAAASDANRAGRHRTGARRSDVESVIHRRRTGLRNRCAGMFGVAHELSPEHRAMRRAPEVEYPHLVEETLLAVQEIACDDDFIAPIAIDFGDRLGRGHP